MGADRGVVAESGRHQRGRELVAVRGGDRGAVELGRARPRGREGLVGDRVQHDPRQHPFAVLTGDAGGELGDPEQEVDRPVERIDQPPQLAVARLAALLAEDRVAGPTAREHRPDRGFGGEVGFGDQVGRGALGADLALAVTEAGPQLGRRRAHSLAGDLEQLELESRLAHEPGFYTRARVVGRVRLLG